MKLRIVHQTEYLYTEPVSVSHHMAHLVPRNSGSQTCLTRELTISPEPAIRRERVDSFGNRCVYFSIQEPHSRLVVLSKALVDVLPAEQSLPFSGQAWNVVRQRLATEHRPDILSAYGFVFPSPYAVHAPGLAEYARPSFAEGRPLLETVADLTKRIYQDFKYDPTSTTVSTPVGEVLRLRRGVCQDFAHLQIACLRTHGLAARYVSGYLLTKPPPGQARLVGADASHAWLSVFVPEFGWVDFDPTNNVVPGEEHVQVAVGRDFGDVAPVRGVILGGGQHRVIVSVDVEPLT
ncbi:MAG: transglutaminase family protein [Deltaproteobacteria bacterium]|nr:transglutaminase family protein [Deltaproteobacteria bacterium]